METHRHKWTDEKQPRCVDCKVLRSDCYRTPVDELVRVFDVLGDVDLDPCADVDPENHLARENWSTEGNREWYGKVFFQPPYSRLAMWVPLCSRPGPDAIVGLIPPSTGTGYWHAHVFAQARAVCFVRGRISFLDPDTGEPVTANRYDSAYVLWGPDHGVAKRFCERMSEVGRVVKL